jgi:LTXXQ motif family protein
VLDLVKVVATKKGAMRFACSERAVKFGHKDNQVMKRNSRFLTVALISAVGLGAGAALAQQNQQQMPMMGDGMGQGMMGQMGTGMIGPGNMGMMGPGMHGMMGPGMMMDFGPMMEGRLAYMKAELGVTEAQTSAWDDYAKAVKARATTMQGMHTTMVQAMQAGSALERLDARTKAMESMVESLKALRPVTEALYKGLSDDQKKKADQLLGMGCCMM